MSPVVEGRRGRHPINDAMLPLFADLSSALAHVRKHVLGELERQAWRLALPAFAAHPSSTRGDRPGDDKDLLPLYLDSITAALDQARVLRWAQSEEPLMAIGHPICVAMGVLGLLVVIDHGRVVTAFFPGQGREDAPAAKTGLRDRWRKPRRFVEEDQASEGPAELIYEKVFSTAFEFVRKSWAYSSTSAGEARHYHILKDALPRSRPKFHEWQLLTVQLRSESSSD